MLDRSNTVFIISGDENHMCGASLHESQDLFESIKAWSWCSIMVISCTSNSIARPKSYLEGESIIDC